MNHSEFYRNSGLTIDESWLQEINNNSSEIVREFISNSHNVSGDNDSVQCDSKGIDKVKSDCDEDSDFSEVDADDNVAGNADTLLDDVSAGSSTYVFAPGEGQHPLSLYEDKNSEYLSFPTIFCGQSRQNESQRKVPVPYSDIAKWELRSKDRRAAHSIPNIFFKLKKLQLKQVSDKVSLAIRRCKTKGKKITAAEARDQSSMDKIVKLDEGYYIFRQLRNSPAYLAARKKDVFAMIRQLGLPTWFMSLSAADTKWFDLLKILAKMNNDFDYSDEEVSHWTWKEKTELIRRDPVTCSRFFDHRVQVFLNTVMKSPHNPVGKVTDYFYRVEFQQRGSPHIHMIVWIENSPKYHKDSEQDITEYVDKHVTCTRSTEGDMSDLVGLQTHKHSKTCRKKGKAICRFGFPLPPLQKTLILEPLEEEIDKYKKKYDQIQQKINSFKDGLSMSYSQFLDEVVQLPEEDYIKCIRSSLCGPKIFLKREHSAVRVNMYNEKLLQAWNANLDIQFVLDPYACAMYIVSYISKSQRGMSALLDRACKEARQGNMNIKQQVRHIGNKFLNSVEVSAQEASYLILQIPLTKATRDVIYINTSPPHERVGKLEELPSESTDVTCDSVIQRYSKRPKALQNWCLADYSAQLEIRYPENYDDSDEVNDDNIEENHCDADGSDTESEDEFSSENTILTLKNGIVIRRRLVDRILRYVHYSLKSDPENHFREKIMLFYPWRNESVDLLEGCCSYRERYMQIKNFVESKSRMYEQHRDEIEQARLAAEEEHDEHDQLAPNAQQSNADDEEEGQTETEEFVHFNPDRPVEHRYYDIGSDVGIASNNIEVNVCSDKISDDEYYQLARSLNSKQREFFLHVMHWIKTRDEPIYAFLSGGAGVGKSVLIRALYQALHRHLHSTEGEDPDDIRILLCAFTGKAAFNINGVTIASAFHKKYNQSNQAMYSEELNTFRVKYRNLSIVIIDEISMVGNKMLNFIDTRLKELTCTNRPFGGISIIAVGDLFQLQPVGDSWIFDDLSDGAQVLANNLWKDHFRMYELTEVMRQKEDLHFANLLNRLRINELTEEDRLEIDTHTVILNEVDYPKDAPHLFCENKFVDNFNKDFISNLVTEKVTVECHDNVISDVPKSVKDKLLKCLPKDAVKTANLAHSLMIAEGMIYDITVNLDVKDGLANGSTCVVKLIDCRMQQTARPSIIWVIFADRSIGKATRQKYKHLYSNHIDEAWTPIFEVNRNFVYNYKSYQRIQFPLKPSAAKTIHKAQGCTVDKLVIDLSQTRIRKTPHIHYVAMSRVRKLENLHILNFNESALCVDERVKQEMERLRNKCALPLCYLPLYSVGAENYNFIFNNARSLHKHFPDVKSEPNIITAHIIGIAESRLLPEDADIQYEIKGYRILRNDQIPTCANTRPPHGLVMYVKEGIACRNVRKYTSNTLEFIVSDLLFNELAEIQIALLYKSPSCSLLDFSSLILEHLKKHINITRPFLIIGDFNFDVSTGSSNAVCFMENTFVCKQCVKEPTTNYGSLLDLIFSNCENVSSGVVECYWSDHKIVYASLKV